MKLIDCSTTKHPNTFVKVDDEDFEWLNQWKWRAYFYPRVAYAARDTTLNKKRTYIIMHRLIVGANGKNHVDHINGDGLDNQKNNLRICTHSENLMNSRKTVKKRSSAYKGVSFNKKARKWVSQIKTPSKSLYLGAFKTQEEAAKAYNNAALVHFGKYANLNKIIFHNTEIANGLKL